MKPRDLINFFKTKPGRLVAFGAVFAVLLVFLSVYRKRQATVEELIPVTKPATNLTDKPQVVQSVQHPIEVFHPPAPKPEPPVSKSSPPPPGSPAVTNTPAQPLTALPPVHPVEVLAPISLFAENATEAAGPKRPGSRYAPFGRLIPCETVITVDSSAMQTPIIGLITENIFHAGKLIIPAGTEVHGTAQTDHQRERIASASSWTLVWQTGEEMQLKALALDREFDRGTNQSGWGITDGSAGLRGEILKTDNLAEIKLFAATFLSGAAGALTEKQPTLFGPINSPSLNNAPLAGAQDVLKTYAQRIYDSIQKDGFYVRIPSGKQFYLYVLQTIDRADATLGGSSVAVIGNPESDRSKTTTPSKP